MNVQQVSILITVLTIVTQSGLYLLSGGFSIGSRVSDISAEIRLLRGEVISQNQIQDYRLDRLEGVTVKKSPHQK
jgi:uncharacterized protein YjfI (DUF2170 family)